jgi:hypothetical protein
MLMPMRLEHWDDRRKKYVLYPHGGHDLDCKRFPFERIPRRVFLDTNVINRLVKWRGQIFDHEPIPPDTEETLALDIEALMHVFYAGSRAGWELVGSLKTLEELSRTRDAELQSDLLDYGIEVVDQHPASEDRRFALDFGRRLVDTAFVAALPDIADRELIGHAIGLGCDAFCTCDRTTIVNKRERLRQLPLRILTPAEWWAHVKPWAGLWA